MVIELTSHSQQPWKRNHDGFLLLKIFLKNLIYPFLWGNDLKNKEYNHIWIFNWNTRWAKNVPLSLLSLFKNTSFVYRWHQQPLECTLPDGWVTSLHEFWWLLATGPEGRLLHTLSVQIQPLDRLSSQVTWPDPYSLSYEVEMAKRTRGSVPTDPGNCLNYFRRGWGYLCQAEVWFQNQRKKGYPSRIS